MSNSNKKLFPPQADHEHEWAALETMIACVVNGKEADYVSTPLTTGPRFMDWFHTKGKHLEPGSEKYTDELSEKVIAANRFHARHFIAQLRTQEMIVIEPTSLDLRHWTQNDYRHLWGRVIERYVRRVWLLDGWQYSSGCAFEFYVAATHGVETLNEAGKFISRKQGSVMINEAVGEIEAIGQSVDFLRAVATALQQIRHVVVETLAKDEALDRLADSHNVAQFVSFSPGDKPMQRFCRILGVPSRHPFARLEEAIAQLLDSSVDQSVNVRSFKLGDSRSYPFKYGCRTVAEAATLVKQLASDGLHTIVNETIDIHDGGVSGVLADEVIEFAPDDTPRCVEKPGTARLPVDIAEKILHLVYGFRPAWDREPTRRVEFSIHPKKRGVRHENTIMWEIGGLDDTWQKPISEGEMVIGSWPNRFSRVLGDKTFGLLVAQALGFSVPHATVFNCRIAPFSFGQRTGQRELWIRTAPAVNQPGRYPTFFFDQPDPLSLLRQFDEFTTFVKERGNWMQLLSWIAVALLCERNLSSINVTGNSAGQEIDLDLPSILAQDSVNSKWAGSLITEKTGPRIEGVRGFGDRFMVGQQKQEKLPENVCKRVLEVHCQLQEMIGAVSMEWCFDGESVWILQLHQEFSQGSGEIIVPGDAEYWHEFDMNLGLESLRKLAESITEKGHGIALSNGVAYTSHAAAILRKRRLPARVK